MMNRHTVLQIIASSTAAFEVCCANYEAQDRKHIGFQNAIASSCNPDFKKEAP